MLRATSVAPLQRYESDRESFVSNAYGIGARTALLVALAFAGCSSVECNDVACAAPHVEISFEPAITEAGHYRFEVDADGRRSTCEVDFIMTEGFTGTPGQGFTGASACGALLLRGGVSRDHATEIVGYSLPEASSVTIEVFRGDESWVEHSFTPRYRGVEVNGAGCGECTVASEVVELP